jgi:hypothetical protein
MAQVEFVSFGAELKVRSGLLTDLAVLMNFCRMAINQLMLGWVMQSPT